MDFDIIEGLSDEEVMSLWEDNVYLGICWCEPKNDSGSNGFGFGNAYSGFCTLLRDNNIYSLAACDTWCRRTHRSGGYHYYGNCHCRQYRENASKSGQTTYGYLEKCFT